MHTINQRGALFGMDARIALLAMAVAAAALGLLNLNRIGESKTFLTEQRLLDYKKSYLSAWVSEGPTHVANPSDVLSSTASAYGDATLGVDPWGSAYVFNGVSALKTIEGQSVTIYFYTMQSNGKNGVNDSVVISTEPDYNTWAPAGDDIGLKFSTYDITHEALLDAQHRLHDITIRLQIYVQQALATLRSDCDILANQLTSTCDFNDDAAYTTDEEFKTNLLPRSTGEATASKYYASGTTYTSGDITGMQNLMTFLGLPTSYAQDLMHRTLYYTSNTTGATEAPFAARVWYQ